MTVRRKPKRNGSSMDLSKGSIPVLIVASLLVFMSYAAYQLGGKVEGFKAESVSVNARFLGIERDISKIRELLERTGYVKPREFKSWCAVTESINKGWKCGDIDQLRVN